MDHFMIPLFNLMNNQTTSSSKRKHAHKPTINSPASVSLRYLLSFVIKLYKLNFFYSNFISSPIGKLVGCCIASGQTSSEWDFVCRRCYREGRGRVGKLTIWTYATDLKWSKWWQLIFYFVDIFVLLPVRLWIGLFLNNFDVIYLAGNIRHFQSKEQSCLFDWNDKDTEKESTRTINRKRPHGRRWRPS